MKRFLFLILLLAPCLTALGQSAQLPASPGRAWADVPLDAEVLARDTDRGGNWDWLAGTYWYVPQEDLPAMLYDREAQTQATVPDQTVFHIVESNGGYFRGSAVVQIGASRTTFVMLGSATPDGAVLLDFLPTDPTATATTGSGRFTQYRRQTAMLNQMSSSPNERLKVLHWAYMLQTRPGDASWNNLPGANVPVVQFLGGK